MGASRDLLSTNQSADYSPVCITPPCVHAPTALLPSWHFAILSSTVGGGDIYLHSLSPLLEVIRSTIWIILLPLNNTGEYVTNYAKIILQNIYSSGFLSVWNELYICKLRNISCTPLRIWMEMVQFHATLSLVKHIRYTMANLSSCCHWWFVQLWWNYIFVYYLWIKSNVSKLQHWLVDFA